MSTLANPIAVPFFDRVPPRLMPALQRACVRIDVSRDTVSEQYKAFLTDISGDGVPGPTFDEFRCWHEDVRLARAARPDQGVKPYEPVAKGVIERMVAGHIAPCAAEAEEQAEDYLRKVHAIIMAAVRLQQAKLDAGYAPESSETEDPIVAEALAEWLTAEAAGWSQAMNLDYTPGEVAMRLLATKNRDQNAKLLDLFALHMQHELALAIAAGRSEGGAA